VRVRDHVVLASGAAGLLFPRVGASVMVPWAASIFIDVDHYLWFLARHRRVNPVAAVRLYNSANAPQHQATRPFHHPGFALLLLLLSRRERAAMLALTGMAFHVGLDAYHRARMAEAKATALIRDQFICQICGVAGRDVVAHLWRQPRVLPSYRVEHLVTVCDGCHEAAHARGAVAIAGLECEWESYRDDVARRLQAKPLRVESAHEAPAGVHATASRTEWGPRSMN
jgi:hypothetical protein